MNQKRMLDWPRRQAIDAWLLSSTEFSAKYPDTTHSALRGFLYRGGVMTPTHDHALAHNRLGPLPAAMLARILRAPDDGSAIPSISYNGSPESQGSSIIRSLDASAKPLGGETAVLAMADTHYGAETRSYDPDTFLVRLSRLGRTMERLHGILAKPYQIDRLVILMLGDMIDGEGIYASQPHDQRLTAAEQQADEAATIMVDWLRKQRDIWGKIEIYCVAGNHGRSGKDRHVASNFDIVFYRYLKDRVGAAIEVHLPDLHFDPFSAFVDIRGHRFLLTHGNHIKSGGVTPHTGLVNRTLRWQATSGFGPCDVVHHGHFHSFGSFWFNNTWLMSNGTMKTDDMHALGGMGWESSPKWWFHGVSDSRPVTWAFPLELDVKESE